MLTPAFELSQDEKFVYVLIKTPYIKISEVEYFIEECQFKFYVKPYFLRLNLPGKVVENGEESASYDVDKGIFTVHLPKLVPGSYFKDLDLLTKLLAPSGKSTTSAPVIEVVSDDHASKDIEEDAQDFDWDWNQDIYDEEKECQLNLNGVKYGFGNQKSAVFYRLKDELKEIVENPNPDELSYSERHLAKIAAEDEKFDGEHYLADFFEDERIQEVLNYVVEKDKEVLLTEEEKTKLLQLPNREYLLDSKEEMSVFFSLVDIMFAYAYNKRTTLGENTVESAWTMSRLSSTLSWFERFTSLQDVFVACCRRSLSYPLYRHWELSCKVMEDVKEIFQLGRRKVLQCLLEILMLFNASEPRYIFNELYITDYCIWIQKVKEIKVESLTKKLLKTNITKDDIGWELRDLELAALLVYDEQSNETESSSSEDSSETEEESSSGDESDGENTNEELDISKKDPKVSPQVSLSVTLCDRGESFGGNLDSCSANKDFIATADEGISSEETLGGVEILPSLIFGKNRFGAKTLVEVIPGESEAKVSNGECTFNDDCESKHIECLDGDGAICENKKETDVQQADTAVKERDLSGKMLDLSMKDNVE